MLRRGRAGVWVAVTMLFCASCEPSTCSDAVVESQSLVAAFDVGSTNHERHEGPETDGECSSGLYCSVVGTDRCEPVDSPRLDSWDPALAPAPLTGLVCRCDCATGGRCRWMRPSATDAGS